jgi:hypothetical protein
MEGFSLSLVVSHHKTASEFTDGTNELRRFTAADGNLFI